MDVYRVVMFSVNVKTQILAEHKHSCSVTVNVNMHIWCTAGTLWEICINKQMTSAVRDDIHVI